jgi:hypothetical protein
MKTKTEKKDWKTMLIDLEKKLEKFFNGKFPSLPEKAKEVIVKFGPYLMIVTLLITIPATLALIGFGAVATPFALVGNFQNEAGLILSIVFGIIIIVLQILALPALFNRRMKGWKILFYASLINVVFNLLSLNLINLIINAGISWYILFQVKSYYK